MSNLITFLFICGVMGVANQISGATTIAQRCLAIALLILCIDQTRMASVDRDNIQTLEQRPMTSGRSETNDPASLQRFRWVTHTTIVLELVGFGLSWGPSWLGWSSIVVLVSQLWFNLLAGVRLLPDADPPIQPWGIKDRAIVLAADTIGLLLAVLYTLNIQPLAMAIGLLCMVLLYGLIKYRPGQSS